MISIVVADDHDLIRRGVKTLLEAEPGFSIIAEASGGLQAVSVLEELKPDVLVIDIVMPGLSGLEVIRRARDISPHTQSVVLSMYDNDAYVLEALRVGARGYVLKRSPSKELVSAIRATVSGSYYLVAPVYGHAVEAYTRMAQETRLDPYEMLTMRQREVLHLVAEGFTSAEIAERLCISRRTAENHRSMCMQRLSLHTQTDLIRYALRHGILPAEPAC